MRIDIEATERLVGAALEFMGRDVPDEARSAIRDTFHREISALQLSAAAGQNCWVREVHVNCGHFPTPWPTDVVLRTAPDDRDQMGKAPTQALTIKRDGPVSSGGGTTYCISLPGTGCELCWEWYCE